VRRSQMEDLEKQMIRTLADANMNVCEMARVMNLHRNTAAYHLKKIRKETGKDPCNFYDLIELLLET